jgi:hypothetical protein
MIGGQIRFVGHLLTLFLRQKHIFRQQVAVVHRTKNGMILCLNFNAYLQDAYLQVGQGSLKINRMRR